MMHDLHVLLAVAIFGSGFYVADINSRPSASLLVNDAFHQLAVPPARGSICLPMSHNIEDRRRDSIAALIEGADTNALAAHPVVRVSGRKKSKIAKTRGV